MRLADIACYVAKRAGRNRYHVFSGEDTLEISAVGELRLVTDIRQALLDQRLILYFQEIACIQNNDETRHYEVLLRMQSVDGNIINPAVIIPTAERFNIMSQIDIWVVSEAIKTLSGLQTQGHDIAFSINLSGTSLGDDALRKCIRNSIEQYQPKVVSSPWMILAPGLVHLLI